MDLKLFDHVTKADDGTFKGSRAPMVDLGMYEFKHLNTGNITPEESFMNIHAEEIHELEQVRISTKQLRVILYAKYKKAYLNKVIKTNANI